MSKYTTSNNDTDLGERVDLLLHCADKLVIDSLQCHDTFQTDAVLTAVLVRAAQRKANNLEEDIIVRLGIFFK